MIDRPNRGFRISLLHHYIFGLPTADQLRFQYEQATFDSPRVLIRAFYLVLVSSTPSYPRSCYAGREAAKSSYETLSPGRPKPVFTLSVNFQGTALCLLWFALIIRSIDTTPVALVLGRLKPVFTGSVKLQGTPRCLLSLLIFRSVNAILVAWTNAECQDVLQSLERATASRLV